MLFVKWGQTLTLSLDPCAVVVFFLSLKILTSEKGYKIKAFPIKIQKES